jgi:prophage antirepressor-like protein
MQYELQIFEYEDRSEFRILDIDSEPWFVLADVCRALNLQAKNGYYGHHAERLDPDERRVVPRSALERTAPPLRGDGRGARVFTIINESGLYSLIFTSAKPEAKRFKKWVTSEVLPAIRRTGRYAAGGATAAFIRRYNENWDRVEPGYFSVISELVWWLWVAWPILVTSWPIGRLMGRNCVPMLASGDCSLIGYVPITLSWQTHSRCTGTRRRKPRSTLGSTRTACSPSSEASSMRSGYPSIPAAIL